MSQAALYTPLVGWDIRHGSEALLDTVTQIPDWLIQIPVPPAVRYSPACPILSLALRLTVAFPVCVPRDLIVVMIYISLVIDVTEYLFIYL